jgi:hypothetical protein
MRDDPGVRNSMVSEVLVIEREIFKYIFVHTQISCGYAKARVTLPGLSGGRKKREERGRKD